MFCCQKENKKGVELNIEKLTQVAKKLRKNVVEMIGPGKKGHLGGSCSSAEIITILYFHEMKVKPEEPLWADRDLFLFSKGHSALMQYAALGELGYFEKDEFKKFKNLGSLLQGHPETTTPGIEANTGSLGQGLSIACGMAAGIKIEGRGNRVFCIMGDGEQAEGQIWEAAMAATFYQLDNLYAFVDRNRIQATGPIKERYNTEPLPEKWKAFGWYVQEVDGHNIKEIIGAIETAKRQVDVPKVIIANTTKGKGLPFAENRAAFHNGAMTSEEYMEALKILK